MSDYDIGRLHRSPMTDASPNFFGRSPDALNSQHQSLTMSPLHRSMHGDSNESHYQSMDHMNEDSNQGRSSFTESSNQSNNQSLRHLSPPLGAMGFMKEMNGPPSVKHSNQGNNQNQSNNQSLNHSSGHSNDGFSLLHPASPVTNSSPSPSFGFEPSPLNSPAMVPLDRSYQSITQSNHHQPSHGLTTASRIYSSKKNQKKTHSFLSSPSPQFTSLNQSSSHTKESIKQSPVFTVPPRRSPRFAPNSNFLTGMSPTFFGSPSMSFSLPPTFTPLNHPVPSNQSVNQSPSFTPLARPGDHAVRRSPRLNPSLNHSMNQSMDYTFKRDSGASSPFFTRSLMDESLNQSNNRSVDHTSNQSMPQTPLFPPLEDPAHSLDSLDRSGDRSSNRSILRTMHQSSFSLSEDHSNNQSNNESNSSRARKRRRSSVDSARVNQANNQSISGNLAVMPQFTPELTGLNSFYDSPNHQSINHSYNQSNSQSYNRSNHHQSDYTLDMNGNLSSPALIPFNSPEAVPINQSKQSNNQNNRPTSPISTPGSQMSMSSSSSSSQSLDNSPLPSNKQPSSQSSSQSSAPATQSLAASLNQSLSQSLGQSSGGNGSGSSCHQCKSRRSYQNLIFCSNMFLAQAKYKQARDIAQSINQSINQSNSQTNYSVAPPKLDKKSICRKKYCETCLVKFYSDRPPRLNANNANNRSTWTCPACRDVCCCAACRRQKDKCRSNDPSSDHSNEQTVTPSVRGSITLINGALPPPTPNQPLNQSINQMLKCLSLQEVLALAIVHLPQWGNKFTKPSKKHRSLLSITTNQTSNINISPVKDESHRIGEPDHPAVTLPTIQSITQPLIQPVNQSMNQLINQGVAPSDDSDIETPQKKKKRKKSKRRREKRRALELLMSQSNNQTLQPQPSSIPSATQSINQSVSQSNESSSSALSSDEDSE